MSRWVIDIRLYFREHHVRKKECSEKQTKIVSNTENCWHEGNFAWWSCYKSILDILAIDFIQICHEKLRNLL